MTPSGISPEVARSDEEVSLTVAHQGGDQFRYTIRNRGFSTPSFAWAETRQTAGKQRRHYRAIARSTDGEQPHDVTGFSSEQVINDILKRYARFRQTRHLQ